MNFLGGALPNVMFIIGMLAIGLGLGIELKLVPLNKEIDKTGRIGAIVVGAILVVGSLYIYLNPSLANPKQPISTAANAAPAPGQATSSANTQLVAAAPDAPTAASLPTAAPAQIEAPAPTPTLVPTAAPAPTEAPAPTATLVPTAVPPTAIPSVAVPDLHGKSEKDARDALSKLGLQARKVDKCTGSDQGDPKPKKHSIQCQNPAGQSIVPLGTVVEYVVR